MKIYNASEYSEKLKIRPVNISNMSCGYADFGIIKQVVKDIDGNSYDGIKIGDQIWMVSNLMVCHFNDGEPIKRFNHVFDEQTPYFDYPDIDTSKIVDYGLYYNFVAVESEKLAPAGWHIPSLNEWETMLEHVCKQSCCNMSPDNKEPFGAYIGKSLASKSGWIKGSNGNDGHNVEYVQTANNETGFNMFPSGYFNYKREQSEGVGWFSHFWCSSPYGHNIFLTYNDPAVYRHQDEKAYGYNIRYIKD